MPCANKKSHRTTQHGTKKSKANQSRSEVKRECRKMTLRSTNMKMKVVKKNTTEKEE